MARQQAAQHKPARDERRSKELQDAKRENNTLRRKLARAQKEIEKLSNRATEPADYTPMVTPPKVVGGAITCGSCGSANVKTLVLPSGTNFSVCQACGKRVGATRVKDDSLGDEVARNSKTS